MAMRFVNDNNIRRCIYIGICSYAFYITTNAFNWMFGTYLVPKSVVVPVGLMGIVGAALLTHILEWKRGGLFIGANRLIPLFGIGWTLVMLIQGAAGGWPFSFFYSDMEGTVLFFGSIFLGARRENWKYIDTAYMYVLMLGILLSIIALTVLPSLQRNDTETSLLNRVQFLLYPVGFFIFTYKYRVSQFWRTTLIVTFSFYFIEQFIFQKRAPTLRIAILFLLMVIVHHMLTGEPVFAKVIAPFKKAILAIVIILSGFYILSLAGIDISESLYFFKKRTIGKYGIIDTIMYDGRYQLALAALSLVWQQYFWFGTGFGGVLYDKIFWWRINVDGENVTGMTSAVEVGVVWPLWKGGIIFWMFLMIVYLRIIFSLKRFVRKRDQFALFCWSFVLVHVICMFLEFYWINPAQLYTIVLGSAVGYALSKNIGIPNTCGGRLAGI